MEPLLNSLTQLFTAAADLFYSVGALLLPWLPLIAWLAFWIFAVNWVRLRAVLASGGWIGLLLLSAAAVLVWGSIAPPEGGSYALFGLTISNFVGKTVYVSGLVCLMLLAGAVQLSGCCAGCCSFSDDSADDEGHGHHGDALHSDALHASAHH